MRSRITHITQPKYDFILKDNLTIISIFRGDKLVWNGYLTGNINSSLWSESVIGGRVTSAFKSDFIAEFLYEKISPFQKFVSFIHRQTQIAYMLDNILQKFLSPKWSPCTAQNEISYDKPDKHFCLIVAERLRIKSPLPTRTHCQQKNIAKTLIFSSRFLRLIIRNHRLRLIMFFIEVVQLPQIFSENCNQIEFSEFSETSWEEIDKKRHLLFFRCTDPFDEDLLPNFQHYTRNLYNFVMSSLLTVSATINEVYLNGSDLKIKNRKCLCLFENRKICSTLNHTGLIGLILVLGRLIWTASQE